MSNKKGRVNPLRSEAAWRACAGGRVTASVGMLAVIDRAGHHRGQTPGL